MEKWCDYTISNIRVTDGEISAVYLHEDMGSYIRAIGVKTDKEVIALIDKGYKVMTMTWGYPKWYKGANVTVVNGQYQRYLRTQRDKTEKDNLENLPKILK